MKAYTVTRIEHGMLLGSRSALEAFCRRHTSVIRRNCAPIACDTTTRALLFDLDASQETLRTRRRVA